MYTFILKDGSPQPLSYDAIYLWLNNVDIYHKIEVYIHVYLRPWHLHEILHDTYI